MEPLHRGVEYKDCYSDNSLNWVTVCKDSGGYATEACKADPRGDRTQSVLVYGDDYPRTSCDKHVLVDYCASGDGVPNQYCKQIEGLTFSKVGLLKVTEKELEEIKRAQTVTGLEDGLFYLVDSNGSDRWFYGLNGKTNIGVEAPYKLCTKHTEADIKPAETEPPAVSDPTAPGGDTPATSEPSTGG